MTNCPKDSYTKLSQLLSKDRHLMYQTKLERNMQNFIHRQTSKSSLTELS